MTDVADIMDYWTDDEKREAAQLMKAKVFWPEPKQQMVIDNEADIIGFGGAAGGGKSYLGAGLTTLHKRSAIIRPQKNQTRKFVEEIGKMLGSRDGYSSLTGFKFTTEGVERFVNFFGLDAPGDEEKQQGDDYDLKVYDEVTQMREDDIRYTLTWNRTDDPDQRVRAVLTMNPPTTVEGRWVIKFFAPWLDKAHPNPAKDGELRWFATVGDNKDYELGGPQPFIIKWIAGKATPWYNFSPADYSKEDIITPKSRTFIHSYVTDNSYYMKTGYIAQLQLLPEPLRSQMLKGDFMAGVVDNAHQIIPTKWVEAAQLRYRQRRALFEAGAAQRGPLDSIGVDAARGGNMGGAEVSEGTDEMVISKRYGTFFDALQINKGIDINTGAKAAALVIAERMDDAPVHVDVVGVGTSVYDSLNENNIHTIAVNGATSAHGLAKAGNLRFANRRAELHWRLREALDPVHGDDIAIPDDPQLLGDLAAPTWELKAQGITVEGKDAIKKRLGRSPDRGEALMLALMATPKRQMVLGPLLAALAHNSGESYEVRRLRELEGR